MRRDFFRRGRQPRSLGRRILAGLALAGLMLTCFCLVAQSSREVYRNLFRNWREADPNLELDANNLPGEALASRANQATTLASAYAAAHTTALKAASDQQQPNLEWLGANIIQPLPDLASAPDEVRFVNREAAGVTASMATFNNDPDKAIQQLHQAYQREQTALDALKATILARQQAEDAAAGTAGAAEQARGKALQEFTFLTSSLTQSVDAMNQESAGWGTYYSKLIEAAHTSSTSAILSTTPAASASVAPSASGAVPRPPSLTPVPLVRYVGAWSFRPGLAFFGSQPESADLVVKEDNGHATGTFTARFKLPPGSPGDAQLTFSFSGDFKATVKQTFNLITSDGAKGTIDLNPGVAFNEIEVNFNTEAKPGKVHQGDMVLLKQ